MYVKPLAFGAVGSASFRAMTETGLMADNFVGGAECCPA
jgi:hypothetical protein